MTAFALVVSITMYIPHGPVTFCGQMVDEMASPWVAMPYRDHGITWQCGDSIGLWSDGKLHVYPALDTGPFGAFCVMQPDGTCPSIAADVPEPWTWFGGTSTTGRVFNMTEKRLEFERRAGR